MLLEISGIAVECILGDLPHERVTPQSISIDVRLDISDEAASTDRLEDTVDYASLSATVRTVLIEARCRMIERAAGLVCDACLSYSDVRSVTARVTKFGSVPGVQSAAAVLTRSRAVG